MDKELDERVIEIKRVSRKTKGGNAISFSALTVVGDRKGKVGLGFGKAPDVTGAIQKSFRQAKRSMISAPLIKGTVPHFVEIKYKAALLFLKPAPPGSGVMAGGPIRAVLEAAGVRDVVSKMMGSKSKLNNAKATLRALQEMRPVDRPDKELGTEDGGPDRIDELELTEGVVKSIKDAGLETVSDLENYDLTEIKGIGPKTAQEIEKAIKKMAGK